MAITLVAPDGGPFLGDDDPSKPVGESLRISSLDFIRGLAVMGILGANIVAFGQPLTAITDPGAFMNGASDPLGLWWLAQFVLIDGKMRALFSLLFGVGIAIFI